MQSIQGVTPQPVPAHANVSERPLSAHQQSVLEGLVTRIIALAQIPRASVWLMLKSHLELKVETPLLSTHFPAAEKFLSHYLEAVNSRQLIQQIENLLATGNNRQQVYDFIQRTFNLKTLDGLTADQLKQVLIFLNKNASATLPPQSWPAQLNELNVLVAKLSALTGKPEQIIWASMRNISGAKINEQITTKDYPLLTSWLQIQQKITVQSNVTFLMLKETLSALFEPREWRLFVNQAQLHFQDTPQVILTPAQVQDILNKAFIFQRQQQMPAIKQFFQLQYNHLYMPLIDPLKVLKAKRAQAMVILALSVLVVCITVVVVGKSIVF